MTKSGLLLPHVLHNSLHIRFSQNEKVFTFDAKTFRAQLNLTGRFFSGYIQNSQRTSKEITNLQKNRGFADAGLSADQDQRAFDNAAAQHTIQFR